MSLANNSFSMEDRGGGSNSFEEQDKFHKELKTVEEPQGFISSQVSTFLSCPVIGAVGLVFLGHLVIRIKALLPHSPLRQVDPNFRARPNGMLLHCPTKIYSDLDRGSFPSPHSSNIDP